MKKSFFIILSLILIISVYLLNFLEINYLNFIYILFLNLILIEILLRILNRFKNNNNRFKNYYATHPYLPYTLKPNTITNDDRKTNFILQKENYYFPKLKTNNLGFVDGEKGNRQNKKNKNKFLIGCLGNSTTLNYLKFKNKNYSYPLILERILKKKYKKSFVEVNNFGVGLYNSTEILIRFIIQILDLEPNLIIIYCGHNDYKAYLTKNFNRDYSHYRKNIAEGALSFKIFNQILKFNIYLLNFILKLFFKNHYRNRLEKLITKGEINYRASYKNNLPVFERNLESLIGLCKNKKIKIILSSYCFYLHPKIKKNFKYKKIKKIVNDENKIIKKLALKHKIIFVDNAKLIKENNSFFVDEQHFTPKGMEKLAQNMSKKIKII